MSKKKEMRVVFDTPDWQVTDEPGQIEFVETPVGSEVTQVGTFEVAGSFQTEVGFS